MTHDDSTRARILARRARFTAAVIAGIGAAVACGRSAFQPCLSPIPPDPDDAAADAASEGGAERVPDVLTGIARDGKGGPAIEVDGAPVYVLGLDAWPSEWVGKRVEVTGFVETRPGLPEPAEGEEPIGGIVGPYRVIEQATYRLVE